MKSRALVLFAVSLQLAAAAYAKERRDDNVVVSRRGSTPATWVIRRMDIIPDGESGITSLTVAPNGNLYGATSGNARTCLCSFPATVTFSPWA